MGHPLSIDHHFPALSCLGYMGTYIEVINPLQIFAQHEVTLVATVQHIMRKNFSTI